MIQTRDLEAFVQVMAKGSVSLAAAGLNVTQSAVSRRIMNLERYLGQKLFEPHGRGIEPTAFAKDFATHAGRIYRELLNLEDLGKSDQQGPVTLRIAATAQSIETVIAPWLTRLDADILRLELREAGGKDVLEHVVSGVADAGVTSHPPIGTQVMSHSIATLELRAYSRLNLLGLRSRPLDIEKLLDTPILCLDESFMSRRMLDAAFRLIGATPTIVYEGRSTRAILALAQSERGTAILPSSVATDMPYRKLKARGGLMIMNQALVWGQSQQAHAGIPYLRAQLAKGHTHNT